MKFFIKDFFNKFDQIRNVGERVKLTNSILLIRTRSNSQYVLWKCLVYHQRITKVKGNILWLRTT